MQQQSARPIIASMSWPQAFILAIGIFLLIAVLLAQLPGFIFTNATQNLDAMDNTFFAIGALCLGMGVLVQVFLLLHDPKPVIPPVLPMGLSLILVALSLGLFFIEPRSWLPAFGLPHVAGTLDVYRVPAILMTIDTTVVKLVLLSTGIGIMALSVYWFMGVRRRSPGALLQIKTLSLILAYATAVGLVVYVLLLTFISFDTTNGAVFLFFKGLGMATARGNAPVVDTESPFILIILGSLMGLALFSVFLRLIVMGIEDAYKRTAAYMNGVGFIAFGVVFLVVWVLIYPVVTLIAPWNFFGNQFVGCTNAVPLTCRFTEYGGDIITALIIGVFVNLAFAGPYFYGTNRNHINIAMILMLIAIAIVMPLVYDNQGELFANSFFAGAGILLLALVWSINSEQDYFGVGESSLGCGGMWLVMGTSIFVYFAGFAFFSLTNFTEALGFNYVPSKHINDAFWVLLLMGIATAIQFVFLFRKNKYR